MNGGARRDRTADLLHAMQALSQLSYDPVIQEMGFGRVSRPNASGDLVGLQAIGKRIFAAHGVPENEALIALLRLPCRRLQLGLTCCRLLLLQRRGKYRLHRHRHRHCLRPGQHLRCQRFRRRLFLRLQHLQG